MIMIKRVFGKVDGKEVIFDKGTGDAWSVPVPLDLDGEYIVEIIAENDAGIQSFITRQLFTVNAGEICIKQLPNSGYLFENISRRCVFEFLAPKRGACCI